jgi:hypothetical protein
MTKRIVIGFLACLLLGMAGEAASNEVRQKNPDWPVCHVPLRTLRAASAAKIGSPGSVSNPICLSTDAWSQ